MLHIIEGFDPVFARELDLAFRFRHEAFVHEAGWQGLRKADAREIDQFDTSATKHIVAMKDGHVVAYSRLNPTTGPCLLSDVYPHLARAPMRADPHTWEWSRMATSKRSRSAGRGWSGPIGLLLRCVAFAALQSGIRSLLWQAHPVWLTRAFEVGFEPIPLGLPKIISGERVVAAQMDVRPEIFEKMDTAGLPRTHVAAPRHTEWISAIEPKLALSL